MWTLLQTAADWAAYQVKTAAQLGLNADDIAWGNGPVEYPALICSLQAPAVPGSAPRIYSAYVFRADAERLLAAAPPAKAEAVALPGQANFNRWVAAHLLTTARIMRDTALCKDAQFEEWLIEALEAVDAFRKQDVEALAGLAQDKAILDRLQPPR